MILANIRSVKISSPDVRATERPLFVSLKCSSTEDGIKTTLWMTTTSESEITRFTMNPLKRRTILLSVSRM